MKPNEIREMNIDELLLKESDLLEELFNLRFQKSMHRLENPLKLREIKKDIARVKTIIKEKEIEEKNNLGK
ncbi:MAG: 50S ribosomal protein L29 [Candidatus Cloacimonetes bacterium]|nr:50S ribosomal protein L29 [Candidatus Cloacimonadota bacterium]MBL7107863.1 50S ribosomal protein L29 [Candidatus Cloacimonadota bacterium]